ncbi:anthranilate phosphoribosyltransferase [Opitutaceae bacterium EW11]|nr:anthranilate phosphoribosyltransferase [Opitutaceae bacterium EW11]
MPALDELTRSLEAKQDLSPADVSVAAKALTDAEANDSSKVAFLRALSNKGETAAEVAAFAREFQALAVDPGVQRWASQAIDIVGTGGDHAGGFNISTLVVFTLASAGVTVMKHGNRGITSKTGSADLFSALGVNLQAPADKVCRALDELGFVFFFAPAYHPAFKHIAPARKALAAEGRRSIFNILGPLVNPGRPSSIILGVFSPAWVPLMADAMETLGVGAGLSVHGILGEQRGIDELTTATPNLVRGAGRLRQVGGTWTPEEHGFVRAPFDELKGGDVGQNVAIVEAILAGRGPRGLVDTVVFNAGTALWMCGRASTIQLGAEQARECLLGGAVKAKIAATREFYAS